jgi:hypothetical protein
MPIPTFAQVSSERFLLLACSPHRILIPSLPFRARTWRAFPCPKATAPKVEWTCMSEKHTLSLPPWRWISEKYPPVSAHASLFSRFYGGRARRASREGGQRQRLQAGRAHTWRSIAADHWHWTTAQDKQGPRRLDPVYSWTNPQLDSPLKGGRGTYPCPCPRTRCPDVRCAQPAASRAAFANLVDGT